MIFKTETIIFLCLIIGALVKKTEVHTMKEYEYFDGENFITLDLLDVADYEVRLAITDCGHISVRTYDLYGFSNKFFYFKSSDKVFLSDFIDL